MHRNADGPGQFWARYKELAISDVETGKKIGVGKSTFATWRMKDRYPPADRAVAIAQALDTTVEWLVTGDTAYRVRMDPVGESIQDVVEMLAEIDKTRLSIIKSLLSDMAAQAKKEGVISKHIIATA